MIDRKLDDHLPIVNASKRMSTGYVNKYTYAILSFTYLNMIIKKMRSWSKSIIYTTVLSLIVGGGGGGQGGSIKCTRGGGLSRLFKMGGCF